MCSSVSPELFVFTAVNGALMFSRLGGPGTCHLFLIDGRPDSYVNNLQCYVKDYMKNYTISHSISCDGPSVFDHRFTHSEFQDEDDASDHHRMSQLLFFDKKYRCIKNYRGSFAKFISPPCSTEMSLSEQVKF